MPRDDYPVGVPCWIDTGQPDPAGAVQFYGGLFGWEFENAAPADSPQPYFMGKLGGEDVAAVTATENGAPTVWTTYVRVQSADETAAKATEAGGAVLAEPFDVGDSGRMAVLADPSGAAFAVWEPREFRGARVVNEPNTWNFSELNTRDPEGAKAFYRAVLGWETTSFGDGGFEFTFFRVPGYGAYLMERDPELRERLAEDGAPGGFEDAVAVLAPMTDERYGSDVPPHWSITFAVADADATAARAKELGAEVLIEPFDAPYVRMTVLRDPQGATFSASKYVPEQR